MDCGTQVSRALPQVEAIVARYLCMTLRAAFALLHVAGAASVVHWKVTATTGGLVTSEIAVMPVRGRERPDEVQRRGDIVRSINR